MDRTEIRGTFPDWALPIKHADEQRMAARAYPEGRKNEENSPSFTRMRNGFCDLPGCGMGMS